MTIEGSPVTTDIDYEQDGKQISYLKIPYSRNSSAWGAVMLPIIVIKNSTGPTLLFVGGSHGGEYEGPVALNKLARELQTEAIQGRVIIIPALNLPAVLAGMRLSPIDGKDMNRIFPGRANGSISEVIAHYVYEAILPLCDAVLDIHSGGYSLDLAPYISMHYLDHQIQHEQTLAAMQAFNAPYQLIMKEFSGEGLLDYAVERMGKIFLCAEMGGGRLTKTTLTITERGIRNLMKHFKIIAGEPETDHLADGTSRLMEIPEPENYHVAPMNGIYESFFELGDYVQFGQTLGQIHFVEYPNRPPEKIKVERSGMLIGLRGPSQVEIGDCVAVVAQEVGAP